MTQGDFALKVGVSKAAINHFERGSKQPSVATAGRMAELLGLPVQLVRLETGAVRAPSEIADIYIHDCQRRLETAGDDDRADLSWSVHQAARDEGEAELRYEDMTDAQVASWKPLTVVLDDGTPVTEQPPRAFLARVQRLQQHRGKRAARPRARRTYGSKRKSSSSREDPDDPSDSAGPAGSRASPPRRR